MSEAMTPAEVGRAFVECEAFRWMPGMAWYAGSGFDMQRGRVEDCQGELPFDYSYPDVADPATFGCLRALVREAWGKPRATTESWVTGHCDVRWSLVADGKTLPSGPARNTEAEALLAALRNAPNKGRGE